MIVVVRVAYGEHNVQVVGHLASEPFLYNPVLESKKADHRAAACLAKLHQRLQIVIFK